ncbi:MAG TPA: hypothetical protein VIB39_18900 [Candidatus Angelobacter sp.]
MKLEWPAGDKDGSKDGSLRLEQVMKKLSLIGLVVGAMCGVLVALVFGKWFFWLGLGLMIGVMIGASSRQAQSARLREGAKL